MIIKLKHFNVVIIFLPFLTFYFINIINILFECYLVLNLRFFLSLSPIVFKDILVSTHSILHSTYYISQDALELTANPYSISHV